MSVTHITPSAATETSGLFAEAVGGIATVVLTVIALSGTTPEFLLATATIVFGAALLIEGTSIVSDFASVFSAAPAAAAGFQVGTGGIAAVFLSGITGIILGVLALLGINPFVLIPVAVIVFGSALVLSSSAMLNLHMLKARLGGELMLTSAVSGTAGAQALAGIAAIVLGILAVAGTANATLALVALLVLGAAMLATGNGMNNAMMSVFRMQQAR